MNGVFLKEGDRVEQIDPHTGLSRMDMLEDERAFDTTETERRITAPHSNRLILEELKKYADEHERRYGRFPKTLVFAANDLPHTSHADQLVDTARDVFGRGDAFVEKITGYGRHCRRKEPRITRRADSMAPQNPAVSRRR